MSEEDLSFDQIKVLFEKLKEENLQFVQFTGGEPLLRKDLVKIVRLAKSFGFRCGISSNGSFSLKKYFDLIDSGVELFSISLDTDKIKLCGQTNLNVVAENIRELSKGIYVNVGMVLSKENQEDAESIIDYIVSLGCADVKISTDSHATVELPSITKHYGLPILDYRLNRFRNKEDMRGCGADVNKCYLVKNDISVKGEKHYPCLVYAREGGSEIGSIYENIKEDRLKWFNTVDVSNDAICSKYCMDFKVDFNKKAHAIYAATDGGFSTKISGFDFRSTSI